MKLPSSIRIFIFAGLTVITLILAGFLWLHFWPVHSATPPNPNNLPTFTAETLKKYDATDPSLPIYVALDGYVYDVTSGKNFYGIGGTYHRLAGVDGSRELHIFGGSIIKSKYPVIGIYVASP